MCSQSYYKKRSRKMQLDRHIYKFYPKNIYRILTHNRKQTNKGKTVRDWDHINSVKNDREENDGRNKNYLVKLHKSKREESILY